MIGEPYPAFAARFWLGFAAVAGAVLATAGLVHYAIEGLTLLRWGVMGLLTFAVGVFCAWWVWLTPEDRAVLRPRIRPVLSLSSARA
jgi:hypothetical protein